MEKTNTAGKKAGANRHNREKNEKAQNQAAPGQKAGVKPAKKKR